MYTLLAIVLHSNVSTSSRLNACLAAFDNASNNTDCCLSLLLRPYQIYKTIKPTYMSLVLSYIELLLGQKIIERLHSHRTRTVTSSMTM